MTSLDVRVLGRATSVRVPYLPDMLMCDYLCKILVPQVGLRMDRSKVSVLDCVRYVENDKVVTLNFEIRLRKLGDLIPAEAKLVVLKPLGGDPKLWGNATRADVRADCSICLNAHTNFSLGCNHRFHDVCLCLWHPQTCPLCRAPFTKADRDALKLSIIEGLRDGRLLSAPIPIEYFDD